METENQKVKFSLEEIQKNSLLITYPLKNQIAATVGAIDPLKDAVSNVFQYCPLR